MDLSTHKHVEHGTTTVLVNFQPFPSTYGLREKAQSINYYTSVFILTINIKK